MPVRPISDRIKQSLFDILRPRIPGSRFLDLFAGTGAVGLEALSRGAELAVFVDADPRCVKVIERNLERTGWQAKGKAFRANLLAPLTWLPYRAGTDRFDLIFMGPPYKDEQKRPLKMTAGVLERIAAAGLLAQDGWIAAQHHQQEMAPAPNGLECFRASTYGDTIVSFFRSLDRPRGEFAAS